MHSLGERFLAVDGQTAFEGAHDHDRVVVIGRRHHHAVKPLEIEHAAEVVESLGVRMLGGCRLEPLCVYVAERDDIL